MSTFRYSPSLPIEDDPPEPVNDISEIALPKTPPRPEGVLGKPIVLGKLAAKKRLLAFSAAKQNQNLLQRPKKEDFKEVENKDQTKKKPKKGILC